MKLSRDQSVKTVWTGGVSDDDGLVGSYRWETSGTSPFSGIMSRYIQLHKNILWLTKRKRRMKIHLHYMYGITVSISLWIVNEKSGLQFITYKSHLCFSDRSLYFATLALYEYSWTYGKKDLLVLNTIHCIQCIAFKFSSKLDFPIFFHAELLFYLYEQ